MRTVHTIENGERKAVVQWSALAHEYRVRLWIAGVCDPQADYFTDDREDAIGTAEELARDPVAVHRLASQIGATGFEDEDGLDWHARDQQYLAELFESRG